MHVSHTPPLTYLSICLLLPVCLIIKLSMFSSLSFFLFFLALVLPYVSPLYAAMLVLIILIKNLSLYFFLQDYHHGSPTGPRLFSFVQYLLLLFGVKLLGLRLNFISNSIVSPGSFFCYFGMNLNFVCSGAHKTLISSYIRLIDQLLFLSCEFCFKFLGLRF